MIPVGKLKSNLQFNKSLGDLVEVMKLAATLQFNQFRQKEEPSADFVRLLDDAFGMLLASGAKSNLLNARDDLPALYLLVSSDEGFLGELNFLLVNKLLSVRRKQDEIVCVGEQGAHYLKETQARFSYFTSPGEKIDSARISAIRDYILREYSKSSIGKVYVIYPRFVNISSQQVETEVLLPLPDTQSKRVIRPVKNLLIEPDIQVVIQGWIKAWLDFRFYQIFWSSKLAEFAARIMHLEGSVQELGKINTHLRMEYFKYLHALSDKTIRELSASRLLRKER